MRLFQCWLFFTNAIIILADSSSTKPFSREISEFNKAEINNTGNPTTTGSPIGHVTVQTQTRLNYFKKVVNEFGMQKFGNFSKDQTDLPDDMQAYAVACATSAISAYTRGTDIARSIKLAFDAQYGPTWQCIVGKNYGTYVAYKEHRFTYFYQGDYAILLFQSDDGTCNGTST